MTSLPLERIPQLLVSVRSASEVAPALAGGVDLLDIKEPESGSLGMASEETIHTIAEMLCHDRLAIPLSVALGELYEWGETESLPVLPLDRIDYLKIGLSNCAANLHWPNCWKALQQRFAEQSPVSPQWVAVIYADWQQAQAPEPQAIIEFARENGCGAVLIDTFGKTGGSLLELLSPRELLGIAEAVHRSGMPLAVAGQLRRADAPALHPLAPEIVAIRSAACQDEQRNGTICEFAVRQFRQQIQQSFRHSNPQRAS